MGKINGCLKCVFISFNLLFAILGSFLISEFIRISGNQQKQLPADEAVLFWGWVFAISVFGISCLGIFAACSEKLVALRVFASFMLVGMVIMTNCGISVVKTRTQLINFSFNIMLGFLFGFAVLALLGLIITVFMIHQVEHNDADEYVYTKGSSTEPPHSDL